MQNVDHLRPSTWDEYVGQGPLKKRLEVHIQACLAENRPLEHVLLCGPPGAGKTTLAQIIATRLGDPLEVLTMPVKLSTLISIVRQHQGVLLLDEIHRGTHKEQEDLLPLLEFGYLQTKSGRKVYADFLTVVGATTEPQKIIPPLYDRFPIRPDFDDYTDQELSEIVENMGNKGGIELNAEALEVFGQAAGGSPRVARQLVLASRDLKIVHPDAGPDEVLLLVRVQADGLSEQHIRYLNALLDLGGTAGIKPLSNILRLNENVITELERLLLARKMIEFTAQGRELTEIGMRRIQPRP